MAGVNSSSRTKRIFVHLSVASLVYVAMLFAFYEVIRMEGPRCYVPPLTSIEQYKDYISTKQATCQNWAQLGGWLGAPSDGLKLICLDDRFKIESGNCVVLSFGINNEWSFEDDAERLGCQVYAFDPTMGQEDHDRSPNVHFFKLGISNIKGEKKIGMNENPTDFVFHKSFPVDRYENIVRRLGLADRVIDYVKLDVELSEIDFLRDVLTSSPQLLRNINQLAIEVHHDLLKGDLSPASTIQQFWPLYHQLFCNGFSIISSRDQILWREVVWARDMDR